LVSPSLARDPANRMLRALSSLMRTFWKRTLLMMGSRMNRKCPRYGILAHWLALEKVIGYSD
jgi:hypothetical protein